MRITLFIAGIATFALVTSALAQPPADSGNQRPAMTPEPQAALAAKREAELKAPRPIDALDSVWMEKLTWIEVRDAPTRIHFIPEYYDYDSVQKLVKSSGIAEQIEPGASAGSDGIHDEYGIDALMAVADPSTIRIEQRKKANQTTINGVSLLPIERTIEMGKTIVELRAQLTVTAINKALGAKTSQQ